jgi:hypothetical protein
MFLPGKKGMQLVYVKQLYILLGIQGMVLELRLGLGLQQKLFPQFLL